MRFVIYGIAWKAYYSEAQIISGLPNRIYWRFSQTIKDAKLFVSLKQARKIIRRHANQFYNDIYKTYKIELIK